MKKTVIAALLAMMLPLASGAQGSLRYNYTKNGYVYTGAERVRVSGSTPLWVKLSRVIFSDGSPIYLLRIDVEDSTPWKMPKNAPMTITTAAGRSVVLKNSASEPNMVAPDGVQGEKGKVYYNYGEYYLEESDLKKIVAGVTNVDITKRWSSEGYIKIAYKDNEFGSAVADAYEAIKSASRPDVDVSGVLRSLQDKNGSRLAETNVLEVDSNVSIALVYFYYAATNTEGYDLNLFLGGVTVPYGGYIKVETGDGEIIEMLQEKDLAAGRAICYPKNEDLPKLLRSVRRITLQTTGEDLVMEFPSNKFSKVLNKEYNSLQTISIL
ncbi:MAG: hypothetical protein IJ795_07730 [Bacteroidales bacterium]|nr:hypothetical protein [Bacteroidales bacterium]